MAIPPNKTLWLAILLAGQMILVAGEGSVVKSNRTSTASPKVVMSTSAIRTTSSTTAPPPPALAAVMDIFQAPLAAFKPKISSIHQEEKVQLPMSRAQNGAATTPAPPISNILFNAGQGLGSAASSITGWFNNRMIPQAFRAQSSTTKAPQVVIRIPNQQTNKRKPQAHSIRPVYDETDDIEEDEDVSDDDEDNENEDDTGNDDEYVYEPIKTRKDFRQTKKPQNVQYYYIEEGQEDDDFDYDVPLPVRKPQQQNSPNRRRKNSQNKKKQPNQQKRKPVRKNQNGQVVQYVQNRPSQMQVQGQRRPAATFELIPITQNQAINTVQKPKPSTQTTQKRPQFINIPWSKLGFSRPQKETNSVEVQSKPIIVQIPQQSLNRKKRPTNKPVKGVQKPQRKPLRGQLQNQSPVFSLLSEKEIRNLFNNQDIQPSKLTQTSNLPVTLSGKKKPLMEVSEEDDGPSDDLEPEESPQTGSALENEDKDDGSFIVVGPADDDAELDVDLSSRRGFNRGRISQRTWHSIEEDYDEY